MLLQFGIRCIKLSFRSNLPTTTAKCYHTPATRHLSTMPSSSTSAKVIIQLHYNDLRTHDSPVLDHVHSKEQSAVTHFLPIYVFDERIMALSAVPGYEQQQQDAVNRPVTIRGLGDLPRSKSSQAAIPEPRTRLGKFWKTGRHRTKFTVESVFDLKSRYRERGNDLLVACGCMESVVGKVVESLQKGDAEQTYEVTEVWMQKEVSRGSGSRFLNARAAAHTGRRPFPPQVSTEEVHFQRRLRALLKPLGTSLKLVDSKPMVAPEDLPFDIADVPDLYTTYRKVSPLVHSTLLSFLTRLATLAAS